MTPISLPPPYFHDDDINLSDDDDASIQDETFETESIASTDDLPSLQAKTYKLEIDAHMESACQKIRNLKFNYGELKRKIKELISLQADYLAFFEYLSDNKNNIINLTYYCAPHYSNATEKILNKFDNNYKWINCILPTVAHISKYLFIKDVCNKSEELKLSCDQFILSYKGEQNAQSSNMHSLANMQKEITQFQSKLEKDEKEATSKSLSKSIRLVTKIVSYSLAKLNIFYERTAVKVSKCFYEFFKHSWGLRECYQTDDLQKKWFFHLHSHLIVDIKNEDDIQEVRRQKLTKDASDFWRSLEKSTTIKKVEEIFKELNFSIQLPPSIEQFRQQLRVPRFKRDLIQDYYYHVGQRAVQSTDKTKDALAKKAEEHIAKVEDYTRMIAEKIDEFHEQQNSFEEIQAYFSGLHIDIRSVTRCSLKEGQELPLPPTNEVEWRQCCQNDEFIKTLAKQFIDFQEATAQLAMQALRQALLSKHKVECKFLLFQTIQHYVGIFSTFIQLALCNPQFKLFEISAILEILCTDIAKLGIPSLGVFYVGGPLYPGIKFKIESLFMLIAKHFFAIEYKPNEYSVNGYQLMLKIRLTKLIIIAYSLQFLLQQGLLWINISLFENCIQRLNKKCLIEDQRYIDLTEQYEQYNISCKYRLQDLEEEIKQLKIRDANLIIHSHSPSDPIEDIINALSDADIDYFPPLIIEFFENHVGFKLTNESKNQLKEHLEDFFSQDDEDFLRSYSFNQFAYLKD